MYAPGLLNPARCLKYPSWKTLKRRQTPCVGALIEPLAVYAWRVGKMQWREAHIYIYIHVYTYILFIYRIVIEAEGISSNHN